MILKLKIKANGVNKAENRSLPVFSESGLRFPRASASESAFLLSLKEVDFHIMPSLSGRSRSRPFDGLHRCHQCPRRLAPACASPV